MSFSNLVDRHYDPFLLHSYEDLSSGLLSKYAYNFKVGWREKGLAVSRDGTILRMNLEERGYNDQFLWEGEECVLKYVCGVAEEQRRQNMLRAGDSIRVNLSRKGSKQTPELHAILHGIFKRVEGVSYCHGDGMEVLVPHSFTVIVGYETKEGFVSLRSVSDPERPLKKTRTSVTHIVLDTESAAPIETRLTGRRSSPLQVLEVAYYRVTDDFQQCIESFSSLLAYQEEDMNKVGNGIDSPVLKFPLSFLRQGNDPKTVLRLVLESIYQTSETGGFLIAHNVAHDVEQIKETANFLSVPLANKKIRAIDTVKTASNFVVMNEDTPKWVNLKKLGQMCSLPTNGAIHGTLHRASDDALLLLQILRSAFVPDGLDPYVEEYVI